jgi:LCP family protein required for cell wall assembly
VPCGCLTGLLNEAYVEATARHPKRWPGTGAIKGIGAVRGVVSELTGRPIDAVLVADLTAVIEVVDALGGIDIDVPSAVFDDRYPDPIRGRIRLYIPAGPQHVDGRIALAYARSRHFSSDYARMERQQALLLAIRSQIGPMRSSRRRTCSRPPSGGPGRISSATRCRRWSSSSVGRPVPP